MTPTLVVPGDLAACEREESCIPGSIQPHGALLTLRDAASPILQASTNATALFGCDGPVVGVRLEAALGPEQAEILAAALANIPLERQPCSLGAVRAGSP